MFPYLSDLTNYLFGFSFSFPLPTFGMMVAIAFIAANYLFVLEMKRKEREGLLSASKIKIIEGEKASLSELLTNGLFGFLIGYKVLGVIFNYSAIVSVNEGLPNYILSAKGNIIGGLLVGGLMAFLKYREAEKNRLPEPKEVEKTVRPYEHVGTMTFIAAVAGILGAKLFDAVEDLDRLFADPIDVIFSASGLSIYGGLIVGGGSVVYYAYKKGLKMVHVVDACAPGLMLAYGIGRIGCQLSGDGDWGMPNDLPMPDAISFLPEWMWKFDYPGNISGIDLGAPDRPVLIDGMTYTGNAWPTPFYETVMAVIIFGILWALRNKIKVAGVMFSVYLMFNSVERFFIEKIRVNKTYDWGFATPTQAEIIAVLLFVAGGLGVWYAIKKHKG